MKNKYLSGLLANHTTIWLGCATAFCALSLQTSVTAGTPTAPTTPAAAPAEAGNLISLTIGGAIVGGSDSGMRARTQTNGDFYGGIDALQFSKAINDSTTFTLDGHALPGLEDYEVNLELAKDKLGYLKAGYKEFRTWYNGYGGYVPDVTNGWAPVFDDQQTLDRGEVYVEAGLRMENLPEITFKYTHGWRDGQKDSTMWGANYVSAPTNDAYGIVPAILGMDEERDLFELGMTYTLGNTDLGLGLSWDHVDNNDSKMMLSRSSGTAQTTVEQDPYSMDLFNVHATSETRFNERMLLSFGYSYTDANIDTDNSMRSTVPTYGRHDFDAMTGNGGTTSNVVNVNFWWNPIDSLVIVPSFRAEWTDENAASAFDAYGETTGGTGELLEHETSDASTDKYTESIELRYSGIDNVLFYGKVEAVQLSRDVTYRSIEDDIAEVTDIKSNSSDVDQEKYVVGANWYPLSGVTLTGEYYYKIFNQDYDNSYIPATGNEYDAQIQSHDVETNDFNVRLTWRAMPNLTFVTRYDYQNVSIDNQGINSLGVALPTLESADINRSVLSESVSWMPCNRVYVQGSVGLVWAETDTPADGAAPYRITDCDNDSITANLTVGYALSDSTDLRFSWTFLNTDNYELPYQPAGTAPTGAGPGSVGYGTATQENVFALMMTHQINPNMVWNLGYSFWMSNTDMPDQTGGYSDFTAHMISTGLQIRF